jgi:dienelactone hydrolase
MQAEAEQFAIAIGRTFVNLARPGTYGSSGNHHERRREREVALVDDALDRLKDAFGWQRIDLAGLSGGGHLVAALMGRRGDIGRAVIASGNVAVRMRNQERGMRADSTGYSDFVDPIDLVSDVAQHPPGKVIVLTDPRDKIVPAAGQAAYVRALRDVGVAVEHRFLPATDAHHHILRQAAILAVATHPAECG